MRMALLGATGYGGIETLRILQGRTDVEQLIVGSDRYAAQAIEQVLPQFRGSWIGQVQFTKMATLDDFPMVDVALLAMPHGEAPKYVDRLLDRGIRAIDFSGDYRLPYDTYELWYQVPERAHYVPGVYGLPELYRDRIRNAELIANPGCYATAAELACIPLMEQQVIDPSRMIIDAKSGVSGAGRSPKLDSHFVEVDGSFRAYKVGQHQHTPEIEQILQDAMVRGSTNRENVFATHDHSSVRVLLTTQLLPIKRGIYLTAYAQLTGTMTTEEVTHMYKKRYETEPFIKVLPSGDMPEIRHVVGTNECHIGIHVDDRTQTVMIVATIDNLVKGAAGQALQNANLMLGIKETTGLEQTAWC